jgi:hypothetical protein
MGATREEFSMTIVCRTLRGNLGTKSSSFLQVVLLSALLFLRLGVSAQNAPAGPIAAGTPSDPAPSTHAQAPVDSPLAHPHLAGTWQLNKKQSDDPREKMREARGEQGDGGGGGWGGRGTGGAGQRRGEENDMTNEFAQLTVTQTDSAAKVTGKSGRVLAFYSSADQSQNQSEDGDSKQADNAEERSPVARWQQGQLVVTTQTRRGSTTRSYELSPDGKQLYVTTRVENQRLSQPVVIRFVYDPIKPGE